MLMDCLVPFFCGIRLFCEFLMLVFVVFFGVGIFSLLGMLC